MTHAMRDRLDAKVREGKAKGFPTERAALATNLLASALDVDGMKEDEPKKVVRALKALLGEVALAVPALDVRASSALRAVGLSEDRIGFFLGVLGLVEAEDDDARAKRERKT